MSNLIFKPDGLYSQSSNGLQSLKPEHILQYLDYAIEVEDFPTLSDLFKFLSAGDILALGQCFNKDIALFISDLSTSSDASPSFSYLELIEFAELFKPTDNLPWLTHYVEFNGVIEKDDLSYSINMLPINSLKDIPLRISPVSTLAIVDWQHREEKRHTFQTRLTLRSFLKAIFDELSFYGSNNDKERIMADKKRRTDKYQLKS